VTEYSHMPFLVSENEMLFCVGGQVDSESKFRPWRMAKKIGDSVEEIGFPMSRVSHRHRHCSPVLCNGYLSVSYAGKIYYRNGTDRWLQCAEDVHQGYYTGTETVYCTPEKILVGKEDIPHSFSRVLRIVPSEIGLICTGYKDNTPQTLVFENGIWRKLLHNGKPVYKSHVLGGVLAHSVWHGVGIVCYQVETTREFSLEQIT